MSESLKLSRRSFVAGSAAVLAASALGFWGCNGKKTDNKDGIITATMAYFGSNCSPVANTNPLFCSAGWHVYEGLYDFDLSDYSLYNGLAAMKPTKLSSTLYRVVLRDGAKFSNGQTVVAADVVNAFNQNVQNTQFRAYLSSIKQMVAISDKIIEIELNYPYDAMLEKRLAMLRIYPANMSQADLQARPIGSGPWAYENIDGRCGGQITFVPNIYYNGQFPATAKGMDWKIADDNNTDSDLKSRLAYENVSVNEIDSYKKAGANVEFVQSVSMPFLCFNCTKPPFDDSRVRKAIHYAIDNEKLIRDQMKGYASMASCFLPENHPNYHRASEVFGYNPNKAKDLLQQAGCSDFNMTILSNSNWVSSLVDLIKDNLSNVGINVNVDVQTLEIGGQFADNDIGNYDAILSSGDPTFLGNDADLILTTWYGDNLWMNDRSHYKQSKNNRFTELQTLMQKARTTEGIESQKNLNMCFDVISEQCPIYPLFHRQVGTAYYSNKLKDFNPIATSGLYFIGSSVALEQD